MTVAFIAGGLALFQLFGSDKLALRAMGAREVTPQQAPELHAMIERLCVQADLPKPKVAVADTRMPNAFALGRSPKSATVCATTGIMELLSPAELEGVMAHELTHVANRDVLVMTLAGFFATIAAYIVQFGFFFGGGGGYGDDDDNPSFMVLFLVSIAVYVISFFLMQALSRYREFAADRGAALITGRPSALASALMKISSGMERIPQKDLRASSELSAFYIFPPGAKGSISGLFATHPPMEKRIEALQRLEAQLHTQGPRVTWGADGLPRRPHRQAQDQGPGAGPHLRDGDGGPRARGRHGVSRARGDRLPAAGDERLRRHRGRHGGAPQGHRREISARPSTSRTTSSATAGWSWSTSTSRTSWSGSTASRPRCRPAATGTACWPRCSRSATRATSPSTGSTTTSGRVLPVRAGRRRAAARLRARAPAAGPDRRRAARRGAARALVPALGHPDLS